ncbi:MAG: hypothetical protein RDO_0680 [Flavobacteriales endosymbiont of Rhyzopertha dominica]|nr:MAG: thioredoxin domain-containing protein [Candidatus Shikimatogenerans bostrichidophilus]
MIIKEKEIFNTIKNNNISILDFWAPWCTPCLLIKNIINDIIKIYKDKILIIKINVDNNKFLHNKFNVYSIPTLIFYKKGIEIKRNIGLINKKKLINIINKLLKDI